MCICVRIFILLTHACTKCQSNTYFKVRLPAKYQLCHLYPSVIEMVLTNFPFDKQDRAFGEIKKSFKIYVVPVSETDLALTDFAGETDCQIVACPLWLWHCVRLNLCVCAFVSIMCIRLKLLFAFTIFVHANVRNFPRVCVRKVWHHVCVCVRMCIHTHVLFAYSSTVCVCICTSTRVYFCVCVLACAWASPKDRWFLQCSLIHVDSGLILKACQTCNLLPSIRVSVCCESSCTYTKAQAYPIA